jgi:mannose-6-phosphate isomerase-like protein (cupin superfamily)
VDLEIAPGAGYPVGVLEETERVVYVCAGAVTHRGSGDDLILGRDAALTVLAGGRHGLTNEGDVPALVLVSYTGVTSVPWDGDGDSSRRPEEEGDAKVLRHRVHEVEDDPYVVPEHGFNDMRVSFSAAAGAEMTTFGSGRWPGGKGQHMWHRHVNADEVIYLFEGEAQHMTEAGTLILREGDFAYVPAGEWHSMRSNAPGSPLDAIYAYLGGADLQSVGYELRDEE